ncbi:MAG TPA: wax ester/triacylglycerol synthase family O-acyltransferase [Jatrophihabitans sp.]|jgi:diacylglycerol O-acyltransferase|uniref:wax ester/triacylglycerol synthase family O-acyltransferase n=1 Tax=Jatrophihabitans sp. TaxID=1932789 RepID=UPI002DF84135|nr:wax ester/triacylglycerol synthase family O-acyltransferase [Jatrophihabitans sp.]
MQHRLTPLSTAFLDAEDAERNASLAIGSLAVFEGPAPAFTEVRDLIAGRLPLIPRYTQKLRTVPFDLVAPRWVDDPEFDLSWHVRATALPTPGGRDEIGHLMSRVMSRRMDRNRPLWEYWFVEGLAGGRWALLSKLHHCMVDGVSGTDIYRLIFDAVRFPTKAPDGERPTDVEPVPAPLARRALNELGRRPADVARIVVDAARSPGRVARRTALTAAGLVHFGAAVGGLADTSLTGPIGASRRYAWTGVPLSAFAPIRHRFGVSLNDVAVAAVTAGFRDLLLARGEEPTAHTLRSLVPISTRRPGEESIPDNRVAAVLPYLPVHLSGAEERLLAVHEAIRSLWDSGEPAASSAATSVSEHLPFAAVALGLRTGFHLPQHVVSTVTTNVPGPRAPLYACGRRLEEILPYVPIANRVRIGVAMFSYCDSFVFGVTADYRTVPDVGVLVDGTSSGFAELATLAAVHEHS